ncbi:MAG: hypothetical protein AAB366_02150 [Patescibacteria group bacterium]
MKTIKSIFISILFIPVLAFAHEPAALPNAGLTPESAFYFVDKLGEALREFFTFNPEAKAHLQIDFAAERIAEIKIILETKGVNAKGLEVAQSRLQANIAKAAGIIEGEKSKGKDVSELAKSISDDFDANKEALKQAFKDQERALEAKEDELKAKIREARRAGDTAQVEALVKELGEIKAQKELLELKEEEQEDALEQEEEKIEREMDKKEDAEKAIKEVEEEKQELLGIVVMDGSGGDDMTGIVVMDGSGSDDLSQIFTKFDRLLAQAKELFAKENYVGAKQLAKQAEKILDEVEDAIEDLEEAKEEEDELKEEQEEQTKEGAEKEAERLENGQRQKEAEKQQEEAEEQSNEAGGARIVNPTENPSTSSNPPTAKDTGDYTFTITGRVTDNTYDPSGMTDGVLAPAGVVIRAIGPKTVTTQTRTDGSYTLSFTNTPLGTYDVCITPPSGYTTNPLSISNSESGCDNVVVRLRNDTTLDFFYGGGRASHATIYFDLRRTGSAEKPINW